MYDTHSVVPNRYRGTTTYHKVFCRLIKAATTKQKVYYQQIAAIMGLPESGHHMSAETGHMLGEISEDEHNQSRSMLSAVAVQKTGKEKGLPGAGFFTLACQLHKLEENATAEQKEGFWENELNQVYEKWSD